MKTVSLRHDSSQGAIAVYMALVIVLILLASGLILSSTLSSQLRSAEDVLSSERSFYAANSGLERALYTLVRSTEETPVVEPRDGQIEYGSEVASYHISRAGLITTLTSRVACVLSEGSFRGVQRRTFIGGDPDDCE